MDCCLNHLLQEGIRSTSTFLAGTGVSVLANLKFAQIARSMVFALCAVKDTEQKTMNSVPQCSSLDLESELLESQGVMSRLLKKGPQQLDETVGSLKCTLGAGHHTRWEVLKKYLKGTPKYSSIIIDRYLAVLNYISIIIPSWYSTSILPVFSIPTSILPVFDQYQPHTS